MSRSFDTFVVSYPLPALATVRSLFERIKTELSLSMLVEAYDKRGPIRRVLRM